MNTRFFIWITSWLEHVLESFLLRISDHCSFILSSSFIYESFVEQLKEGKFMLSIIPKNLSKSLLAQFRFFVRSEGDVRILLSFIFNAYAYI